MPKSQEEDKRQAAREVIDILHEISTLLVRPKTQFPATDWLFFPFFASERNIQWSTTLTVISVRILISTARNFLSVFPSSKTVLTPMR